METTTEGKLRVIHLSFYEICLIKEALERHAFSDENSYGSLACEKLQERLDLILTNQ